MHFRLHLVLTFSLLLNSNFLISQSLMRTAVGCAGSSMYIEHQCVQGIMGQSSITINRQGFIQPLARHQQAKETTSIILSPNPAREKVKVIGVAKGDRILLYSEKGELIRSVFVADECGQVLSLDLMPAGTFVLTGLGVHEYIPAKLMKID